MFLLPVAALAQDPPPTGDDVQQSYQALINDLARANVSLNAQHLADQRELMKLRTKDKPAQPEKPHGP